MKTIKGPAIFLAQFAADQPPFNSLAGLAGWAASLGYEGIQIPTWDARLFDLDKAASSKTYCDEITGVLAAQRLVRSRLWRTGGAGQPHRRQLAYAAGGCGPRRGERDGYDRPLGRREQVRQQRMPGAALH